MKHGFLRIRRGDDHVCAFDRRADVLRGDRTMLGCEAAGMLRRPAPDPHLLELAHALERGEMGAGLNAAADQRQNAGVGERQPPRYRRRHRSRAHFGDQRAIHRRQRFAGVGAHEHDHRVVRRDALAGVGRIEADEFQAHRILRDRRHDAEIALAFLDRQHGPHGLQDLAGGEIPEGLLHRVDEQVPLEDGAHARFVEIARRALVCGAHHLSDVLIASSAFEPGQSSASLSSFSGRVVVFIVSCSPSASMSR